jgi:FdhD protein
MGPSEGSETHPLGTIASAGALHRHANHAMNRLLQCDPDLSRVSIPVNAACSTGRVHERRVASIAEETPVAFRYNGFAHAVMMATPDDLEDFAIGFSRSEGIIEARGDIKDISVQQRDDGISLDISLDGDNLHRYLAGRRVRHLQGRTSCGLCGVEDLEDAHRPIPRLCPTAPLCVDVIPCALTALRGWQPLSRLTRGAHAAAWVTLDGTPRVVREDVGRHNALDKLIGAMLRLENTAEPGFCLITSRCSFEMVQKAVCAGFPTLVSAGAPTALAIHLAMQAGLLLHSLSRDGEPLLFTSLALAEDDPWPQLAS